MSNDWEPSEFCDDETANAIMNCAREIGRLASATSDLHYALKYSKVEGMSVAEAIEVGAGKIAQAVEVASCAIGSVVSGEEILRVHATIEPADGSLTVEVQGDPDNPVVICGSKDAHDSAVRIGGWVGVEQG